MGYQPALKLPWQPHRQKRAQPQQQKLLSRCIWSMVLPTALRQQERCKAGLPVKSLHHQLQLLMLLLLDREQVLEVHISRHLSVRL